MCYQLSNAKGRATPNLNLSYILMNIYLLLFFLCMHYLDVVYIYTPIKVNDYVILYHANAQRDQVLHVLCVPRLLDTHCCLQNPQIARGETT